MKRIDTILFDLGGVLVEIVGAEAMLDWCPALPDLDALWRRWLASRAVREYETGRIGREAFAAAVVDEFALPIAPAKFLESFAWWPRRMFDGAEALLGELAPRYRLASVSNTNELHWSRFALEWQLPSRFHANFPSYAVGRLKPDADYFEHVLASLGVNPGRTLFVDDNAVNIAAAEKLGIVSRRALGLQGVREVLRDLALA